jgi:hypothetical protein
VRMTKTGWAGLVLIGLGLAPLAGWTVWFRTRTWCPVSMPISLTQGSHFSTGEFPVNLSGRYEVEIEATGTTKTIPLETVECLLFDGMRAHQCSVPSVVQVRWELSGDGTVIHGTSDDTKGYGDEIASSGEASRTIGIFRAQKGHRYKLDGDVLADGSRLNAANPRLRISFSDPRLESALVLSGLLRFFFVIVGLVGVTLIVLSVLKQRRSHPL